MIESCSSMVLRLKDQCNYEYSNCELVVKIIVV